MAVSVERRPAPRAIPSRGWQRVAEKELADHLLSARFAILLALLGLAVTGAVYAAASGIRSVAPQAAGSPNLFLALFTVTPEERVPSFFALVGLLAPLLGIAFGFDAVNSERSQGTLPRLLSQPIHRDDVINGKFVAGLAVISLVLTVITFIVAGIGMLRLGVVPTAGEVVRVAVWLVVAIIYVGFWLAFSSLLSVVVRRAATAALVAIAAWLVLALFAPLLFGLLADVMAPAGSGAGAQEAIANARLELALARISPSTLYEEATIVLLNPEARTVGFLLPQQVDRAVSSSLSVFQSLLLVWPQVVGLVAVTVISFAITYVVFMRQEVRA